MKILFTSTLETSFTKEDLDILRRQHDVTHLITRGLSAFPKILLGLTKTDSSFTWFASVYSFIVVLAGRFLGKKSVLIVGGVDAARCVEIGYGIWLSPWKSVLVRQAVTRASVVLVVDPWLKDQLRSLAQYDGRNIRCVPTGYDPDSWFPSGDTGERSILTVAGCDTMPRMRAKGVPFLLDAARQLPEIRFTIVGPSGSAAEWIRRQSVSNVDLVSFLPRHRLLEFYQRHLVYCQPSFFEGLPNSLCEAMLSGCVPVGTAVGGIPTAIGENGFLIPYGDVPALIDALRKALNPPPGTADRARRHIMQNFSLKNREESLTNVIADLGGTGA